MITDLRESMDRNYGAFLESKRMAAPLSGRNVGVDAIHPRLFPFQRDLTRWAIRKGRCALFADTGLGKTPMQLEWARLIGETTLIIAPLSVARQTVAEAGLLNIDIVYSRTGVLIPRGITVTNYEMVDHFDPSAVGAVVLDESSLLKGLAGKTRQKLTAMFANTPYRLCCTATPAPNDITEIANHAEFLGIMSRADMLATFFVHDEDGWRLKKHALVPFYRWLASWGMSIRMPSDLGYQDDGYVLPQLEIRPTFVPTSYVREGMLFNIGLQGIQERTLVRKGTVAERVQAAIDLVMADRDQWIVWCGLNDEARAVARAVLDSVNVEGQQSPDEKLAGIEAFLDGRCRVLVTKPKVAGFGMNFQHCHKMAFVGLSDSWEAYYQCIRRCYRFGQRRPVEVSIVLSEAEEVIYQNVMRKEQEAREMSEHLIENVQQFEQSEIAGAQDEWSYQQSTVRHDGWSALLGDSAQRLAELDDESVDLSVFSPPFMSLYTYSPSERDIGNSRTEAEFFEHFGFVSQHLLRATRPGRNCCVHVAQVPAMLSRDGYIGLKDFRGKTIEAFQRWGWIYHGEACIDKDPQAQAIRTKSKSLLFVQMHKDASWSRPGLADFIVVFRKPGENATPIRPAITNEQWIEWARPVWYGIRESDTLQYHAARSEDDERHICPLQLGTIERCICLWSNPGELVCSPFMGIGSEGYVALKHGRRFVGVELKPEYFQVAVRNLQDAEQLGKAVDLFAWAESQNGHHNGGETPPDGSRPCVGLPAASGEVLV